MSSTHYGIVLRTKMPYKQSCLVLDYRWGLIETVFSHQPLMQRVHHGMLLEYSLKEQVKNYKIDTIALLTVPQPWVTQDLVFFHTVLDIISRGMMPGSINQPLFTLVMNLYRHHLTPEEYASPEHTVFKTWFLCKLYALVDVYPAHHHTFDPSFFTALLSSDDQKLPENTPEFLARLNRWLEGCKI